MRKTDVVLLAAIMKQLEPPTPELTEEHAAWVLARYRMMRELIPMDMLSLFLEKCPNVRRR